MSSDDTTDKLQSRVEAAEASLAESLARLADGVESRVEGVAATANHVTSQVEHTVTTIKDALDVRAHVRNHPLAAAAVAVGAGFALSRRAGRREVGILHIREREQEKSNIMAIVGMGLVAWLRPVVETAATAMVSQALDSFLQRRQHASEERDAQETTFRAPSSANGADPVTDSSTLPH